MCWLNDIRPIDFRPNNVLSQRREKDSLFNLISIQFSSEPGTAALKLFANATFQLNDKLVCSQLRDTWAHIHNTSLCNFQMGPKS